MRKIINSAFVSLDGVTEDPRSWAASVSASESGVPQAEVATQRLNAQVLLCATAGTLGRAQRAAAPRRGDVRGGALGAGVRVESGRATSRRPRWRR
jgi:hypothetical protein